MNKEKKKRNGTKNIILIGMLIIIGIIQINLISTVSATGFSPTSLIYNNYVGEEKCLSVTIDSTSETISVNDFWAADTEIEWKVSNFNTTSGSHGISIDYPSSLSLDQRQFDVCLSGDRLGEYHGVLLLKEEQEGNSIIQMGIWIKATITEKPAEPEQTTTSSGSSSSSSGGGGGGGAAVVTKNNTNITTTSTTIQTTTTENITTTQQQTTTDGITGGVIGTIKNHAGTIAISFIILVVIAVIINYSFMRKNENENYV